MSKILQHKPLLEAIFEIRWQLVDFKTKTQYEPSYKLLLGRFFDRIQSAYPVYEQLASANIPDEIAEYIVQHRFRAEKDKWPLVQIGPGIVTVNSTSDYVWNDFKTRLLFVLKELFEAHPKLDELKINKLSLRYIDAVEIDYTSEDIHEFLRKFMKIEVKLPDELFRDSNVANTPCSMLQHFVFESSSPKGRIHLRFSTGLKEGKPALIWETNVESAGDDLPAIPKDFEAWLDASHNLTDDWFFKIIEGDLEKRFSGE